MSNFQIKMPKLGESITEGTIISWLVKVGDNIKEDDILFEVTTAKVNAEVPSPIEGKLIKIYFQEGETVPVGLVVADILIDGGDEDQSTIAQDQAAQAPNRVSDVSNLASQESNRVSDVSNQAQIEENKTQFTPAEVAVQGSKRNQSAEKALQVSETAVKNIPNEIPGKSTNVQNITNGVTNSDNSKQNEVSADQNQSRWYSPVVQQLAKVSNISAEELDGIPGTGYLDRLTKKDISNYIELKEKGLVTNSGSGKVQTGGSDSASTFVSGITQTTVNDKKLIPVSPTLPYDGSQPTPALNSDYNTETKDMDIVGRIIADRMVQSKKISAHVTTVVEADVTKLVMWRNKQKDSFKEREGISLTFLPSIVEATTKALKEFPQINASVDGYKVILKKRINLGIAVSLDNGNLIVPVIHDADKLSISGIAHAIDDQAKKARNNKLKPSDIEGGTFTITNFGSFRNIIGTPIINQPEVAILGVGYIEKKPAVIETPEGDVIAIRHKMYLSLSYDHRLINGSLGGAFVRRIADLLEYWEG